MTEGRVESVAWCVQGLQGGQPGPQSGSEECRVGGQEENIRQHGENSASHLLQVCSRDKVTNNTDIFHTTNSRLLYQFISIYFMFRSAKGAGGIYFCEIIGRSSTFANSTRRF